MPYVCLHATQKKAGERQVVWLHDKGKNALDRDEGIPDLLNAFAVAAGNVST